MLRSKIPLIAVFILLVVTTTWSAPGMMSVQVKTGQLRSTPSFLGSVVASVSYGDRVEALQQQGDWIQVSGPDGRQGWMHSSALSAKQVELSAGSSNTKVAASNEELALAGKGFNADIEAEFQADNPNIDFSWVDKMETFEVSPREMVSFLNEGGVHPEKGGAQ